MKGGNDAIHFIVNFAALCIGHAWQGLIPQDTSRHKLHDIKSATDDGFVLAEDMHLGHGHSRARQAFHDSKFTFNGMRRGQQFGYRARLGSHHIGTLGCNEFVGWVGLTPFEHFDTEGAFKASHVGHQPTLKDRNIKGVCACDWAGAHEMIKLAHVGIPPSKKVMRLCADWFSCLN